MKNRYSWILMLITAWLIGLGAYLLYKQHYGWGFGLFVPGMLIISLGWENLRSEKNRIVGIITLFGRRTRSIAEGVTFLFSWFPIEILGISKVEVHLDDQKLGTEIKNVRCLDGDVNSECWIAFIPDVTDDPVSLHTSQPRKLAADKLAEFLDAGEYDDVRSLLVGLAEVQVRKIGAKNTRRWMQENPDELSKLVKLALSGRANGDDNDADDTSGLGVIITKCNITSQSIPRLRDADIAIELEKLERVAEMEDIETVGKQAEALMNLYLADKQKRIAAKEPKAEDIVLPTLAECMAAVDKRNTLNRGVRTVIDTGGNNLVVTDATDKK